MNEDIANLSNEQILFDTIRKLMKENEKLKKEIEKQKSICEKNRKDYIETIKIVDDVNDFYSAESYEESDYYTNLIAEYNTVITVLTELKNRIIDEKISKNDLLKEIDKIINRYYYD